jgi:epidermal growth factor receptor substrate 15
VDRGRYGFANYLKSCGPQFVRDMPRGYVVELVQLLLNKNFLQFRKGKVSFRATAAGRWRRALESVQASGITGATPLLDIGTDNNGGECSPEAMDEEHALTSSTASSSSSSSSQRNMSGGTGAGSSGSLVITSSRGGKGSNISVINPSTVASSITTNVSPCPSVRAASSSPDSSSESSSATMRRGSVPAIRASSLTGAPMAESRPRAATMTNTKSGFVAIRATPPLVAAPSIGSSSSGAVSSSSSISAAIGPSLDFDDPVELLAVKCAEAPSPMTGDKSMTMMTSIAKRGEKDTAAAVADGSNVNPSQVFFPLYHFEKSGEQHSPLWVCVVTLDLRYPPGRQPLGTIATGTSLVAPPLSSFPPLSSSSSAINPLQRPKRFRSTRKAKKLEAQQEAAMRAIESTYWLEAFQPPTEGSTSSTTTSSKPSVRSSSGSSSSGDYMPNIMDDPVVILDRLLIALEQAPVVYTMESAITQHGSGSRTMWTCAVQLALRPRPAHLTSGTISIEQAENGEMPLVEDGGDAAPAGSIRYPTIKWSAAQAKKFDAKGQVAGHVLNMLEKSKHKYPMLFMATPEPLPPRPKTSLMPTMITLQQAQVQPQASVPAPPPSSPSLHQQQLQAQISHQVLPRASSSETGPSTSASASASGGSALSQYHAAQAQAHQAHQLLVQQHQHQAVAAATAAVIAAQQQQPLSYRIAPSLMPHPPAMPPSSLPQLQQHVVPSPGRTPVTLRATADEWQPAPSMPMATPISSSLGDSMPPPAPGRPARSPPLLATSIRAIGPSSQSTSTTSSMMTSIGDRLRIIPTVRTFMSNLSQPSSAPTSHRHLKPSTVVASVSSGIMPSPSPVVVPPQSISQSTPSTIASSLKTSPTQGQRAITPPGQHLRAYVSPLSRNRPVSESALGLGIQWDQHGGGNSGPTSGRSPIPSIGAGSSSARSLPRRLAEHPGHDDENLRALRRSVDNLLDDRPTESRALKIPSPVRSISDSSKCDVASPSITSPPGSSSSSDDQHQQPQPNQPQHHQQHHANEQHKPSDSMTPTSGGSVSTVVEASSTQGLSSSTSTPPSSLPQSQPIGALGTSRSSTGNDGRVRISYHHQHDYVHIGSNNNQNEHESSGSYDNNGSVSASASTSSSSMGRLRAMTDSDEEANMMVMGSPAPSSSSRRSSTAFSITSPSSMSTPGIERHVEFSPNITYVDNNNNNQTNTTNKSPTSSTTKTGLPRQDKSPPQGSGTSGSNNNNNNNAAMKPVQEGGGGTESNADMHPSKINTTITSNNYNKKDKDYSSSTPSSLPLSAYQSGQQHQQGGAVASQCQQQKVDKPKQEGTSGNRPSSLSSGDESPYDSVHRDQQHCKMV